MVWPPQREPEDVRKLSSFWSRRLLHARDVVLVLVDQDLKMLYRRSTLGVGWALVQPLLQVLLFNLVFRRVLRVDIENYPAFVFIGVLVWGWFQSSVVQSTSLITSSISLVRQPGFPLTLLPYVKVGVRLFHFMVAVPILIGLLWWQGLPPSLPWLALPVMIGVQFILTVGIVYPLAAINTLFRDTQHIVSVLMQLMIYVTPVFYSLNLAPDRLRPWFYVNPMVWILESWRTILLHARWPDWRVLSIMTAVAIVLLVVGRKVFVSQSHRFVEEL